MRSRLQRATNWLAVVLYEWGWGESAKCSLNQPVWLGYSSQYRHYYMG
jgi:hypothetical protein